MEERLREYRERVFQTMKIASKEIAQEVSKERAKRRRENAEDSGISRNDFLIRCWDINEEIEKAFERYVSHKGDEKPSWM